MLEIGFFVPRSYIKEMDIKQCHKHVYMYIKIYMYIFIYMNTHAFLDIELHMLSLSTSQRAGGSIAMTVRSNSNKKLELMIPNR